VTALVIVAKEAIPGKVKTRLHPPLSLVQAAELAAASIQDTLDAVKNLPASRRILLFDGVVPPAHSEEYEIVHQSEGGLDERIATLFDSLNERVILIGMDTPQVSAHILAPVFYEWGSNTDAWFGKAYDGGFWALGLENPDGSLVRGVPMSRDDTGDLQLSRLLEAGLEVGFLPELTDVDNMDSALEVSGLIPESLFSSVLSSFV
jgi:glycosyltransferase A (GT-A) superfamily protein (DUF2064 family)